MDGAFYLAPLCDLGNLRLNVVGVSLLHDQDVVLLGHEVLYFVWDQRVNEVEAEDGDICIPIGVCGAKAPKRTQENSIGAALGDDAE